MNEKKRIWLSAPHIGDVEQKYVKEAFDTNWIAPVGPHINSFEKGLSKISEDFSLAAKHCDTQPAFCTWLRKFGKAFK